MNQNIQYSIKYRPKSWNDVIYQPFINSLIERSKAKNWPISILLKGPTGTGKTSVAFLIAKSINCLNLKENGDPCNECIYCESINNEIFNRDTILLDGSQAGKEDVLNLDEFINTNPFYDKKKIIIIEESDQLSIQAKNSFLKILEKPLTNIHFIFLSMEPWSLSQAIQSRCQQFSFKQIPIKEIMLYLKSILEKEGLWDIPEIPKEFYLDGLAIISEYSNGSLRQAIQLIEQCIVGKYFTKKSIIENLNIISETSLQSILLKLSLKDKTVLSDINIYINNYGKLNEFFGISYSVLSEALLYYFTKETKLPDYRIPKLMELTKTIDQVKTINDLLLNVYGKVSEFNNNYVKRASFITLMINWLNLIPKLEPNYQHLVEVKKRNPPTGGY